MTTRNKIEFLTPVRDSGAVYFVRVSGYQLGHGLALSHPVKASEGLFNYAPSWVVYHVATGKLVRSGIDTYKTPFSALLSAKNVGGLYARLAGRTWETCDPCGEEVQSIIGKLRPMPKPKADKVHGLNPAKHGALIALIGDIDAARSQAYRTSGQFLPFTFGKATFRVSASLEALNRFRDRVLKNKRAFSDSALNA